ncbi:MAG: bifunctional (p)ppGpp synthetase/guanosine-3',5'-bis(diphosphate) 3'-pyrophosphohydrolase [Dehalococcoidia bacterium]
MEIKEIINAAAEYLPSEELSLIEQAYRFALEAEKPDLEDALEVAFILTQLQIGSESLAVSLLQGLPENVQIPSKGENKFPPGVHKLVNNVNNIDRIPLLASYDTQSENVHKMFLAMAEDIRVIIINLANRLQLMRNLKGFGPEKKREICEETLDIYVPLAHRLGIWKIKGELEDLAFYHLYPQEYKEITDLLDVKKTEWERAIAHAIRILHDEFNKAGLTAEIEGRPKSVHSIYRKMGKYADQGKEITDIHDLMAIRVLVNEIPDCYNALGIIHSLWHPLPGQFDDYIANPRGNMYQSLHTTVMALQGKAIEIQIRTYEMHRTNEYGMASHWIYKEGGKKDMRFEEKMAWLRQLMEWQQDLSGADFFETLKTDIFKDQVYVFTPMGEIKELPMGSTPLDFAYRIHTDLGHRCTGAKVNDRIVPLTYQLQNGDVVSILSTKAERGPSLDWLNQELGYVKSSHAREKIRQWFRRRERTENLEQGKTLFERERKRLGISTTAEEIAGLFNYDDPNEFLIDIGCGDINVQHIGSKLAPEEEAETPTIPVTTKKPQVTTGVRVMGVGDLLTHIAPCCNPVPGDKIVGFVTRTKGVTIHRQDCPNIASLEEPERLIDVSWGAQQGSYPVSIVISANDRVGLLKDITTVISEAKVNISDISTTEHSDETTSLFLTIEIPGIEHLSRLLANIENLRGVISASRAVPKKKGRKRGTSHPKT